MIYKLIVTVMSEAIPPTNSGQMEAFSNVPLPIEMKLFAAWETRRIPSNCVSRCFAVTHRMHLAYCNTLSCLFLIEHVR